MLPIGRFLRLLAASSDFDVGRGTPPHSAKRLEYTTSQGLPQGDIGRIQPLAPHQECYNVVRSEIVTFRLTLCVVTSPGELLRGEMLTALARFECWNQRNQCPQLCLDLRDGSSIHVSSALEILQAESEAPSACIEACNRPRISHAGTVDGAILKTTTFEVVPAT